jgi:hypothetical protein
MPPLHFCFFEESCDIFFVSNLTLILGVNNIVGNNVDVFGKISLNTYLKTHWKQDILFKQKYMDWVSQFKNKNRNEYIFPLLATIDNAFKV